MGNSSRGFASMSAEKQREIASKGGKAAHQKGTAHQFTSEEARAAGRKGGQASGVARSKKSEKGMSKPVGKSQPKAATTEEEDTTDETATEEVE
jgi:general stress protein YciG